MKMSPSCSDCQSIACCPWVGQQITAGGLQARSQAWQDCCAGCAGVGTAGKLTYADGAVYDGMWSKDVRHGVGTMYSPNGAIFVGTYVSDKRQGLGVTYWGSRCKKHVAEYVDDTPTCGSMLDLADEEVEVPATQQLRDAIAAARVKAAGAAAAADSTTQPCMPELQLVQPSQVRAGAPTSAAAVAVCSRCHMST